MQKSNPAKSGRLRAWLVATILYGGLTGGAAEFPAMTADGYAIPQPGRQFVFPRDHGSHPEFAIEWWYVTGHLAAGDRSRFGFQATFFRRASLCSRKN